MWWRQVGRINRLTYLTTLAGIVAVYGTLLTLIDKPPHIGEILALMLTVPRLHDIGKSGWWAGGAVLAEIVVVVGARALFQSADAILVAGGLFVIVILGLMVWLGCIKGDPQPNAYGEPPPSGYSWKTHRYIPPVAVVNTGAERFGAKAD